MQFSLYKLHHLRNTLINTQRNKTVAMLSVAINKIKLYSSLTHFPECVAKPFALIRMYLELASWFLYSLQNEYKPLQMAFFPIYLFG